MLGRHGQAAAAHRVRRKAERVVQLQRAVTVARRVAPGHKYALRLDLSAYFVLQLVTDLFQKHRGQRVCRGGQGNVSQFHAAQKLVHLGPEGRCQQKDLVAALQMARQVAAAVFQRQGGTRQTAVHRTRRSSGQHGLLGLVQQGRGGGIGRPAGRTHVAQRRGAVNGGGLAALHYSRSLMPS